MEVPFAIPTLGMQEGIYDDIAFALSRTPQVVESGYRHSRGHVIYPYDPPRGNNLSTLSLSLTEKTLYRGGGPKLNGS